jgi:hypothetical protein
MVLPINHPFTKKDDIYAFIEYEKCAIQEGLAMTWIR